MKMKKYLVALLTLVLLATSVSAASNIAYASSKIEVDYSGEVKDFVVTPGTTTKISIPVIAKAFYVNDPVATVTDSNKESMFYISKAKIRTKDNYPVTTLIAEQVAYVDVEIRTKETAGIGTYPLNLNITGENLLSYDEINENISFNVKILEEKAPTQLTVPSVTYHGAKPGKNVDVALMLRNEGEITARNTYLKIDYTDSGLTNGYTATNIKIGDIDPGREQVLSLPMKVLKTATAGSKTLKLNFSYKDIDGNALTSSYEVQIDIAVNEDAPNLDITNITYKNGLQPGDKFELKADLHNYGEANAKITTISLTSDNVSFIKDYLSDTISANEIKVDHSKTVSIPLLVSKSATADINPLILEITYEDNNGVVYRKVKTLYLTVVTPEAGKENIIVSNVKQSPAQPVAGERMEISFDFENRGSVDIDQIKLSLANLTGDSFVPVSSEPYQYINDLKAGSVKRITIPLTLSKSIEEGLHNLTINYEYNGSSSTPIQIPVLNVQNDLGSNSKPKLIISKYEADVEEIRAGSTFNFTFDIYNTHSSVAAKNITVKVASSESGANAQSEVFSVTQGSNSFFISKIAAGESVKNNLELKVKSDAATMAYPIYLIIEYEYDGIEPNPQTGQIGEKQTEELSLQVVENSRPVVDYVSVYAWDGMVIVNNPATISFEFYNMGKSMLNNVVATVEGDYAKSGGELHFIGNVPAGDRSYAEFEAIPLVEGMAKGTIRITFEDSNGDEVLYTKEFEYPVNGPVVWNPDMGGDTDVFNPIVPEAKKAIMPTWLFVVLEVVIFLIFIPITYKIIVSAKRRKLRKIEEANY